MSVAQAGLEVLLLALLAVAVWLRPKATAVVVVLRIWLEGWL